MDPAEQARWLATLNDRRSSVSAKGHRQPANLQSGFPECWSWPSQRADAASAPFMVPARRHDGTYVCPNAHQVVRPKPGTANPAAPIAANLGIADSKSHKGETNERVRDSGERAPRSTLVGVVRWASDHQRAERRGAALRVHRGPGRLARCAGQGA